MANSTKEASPSLGNSEHDMTVGDVGLKNLFEQKFFKKQFALRGARGAECPTFTAEGQEKLKLTLLATDARKTEIQQAAFQKLTDHLLDSGPQ